MVTKLLLLRKESRAKDYLEISHSGLMSLLVKCNLIHENKQGLKETKFHCLMKFERKTQFNKEYI